jgi:glycosyltransferase involved in cell wall biosynthesis
MISYRKKTVSVIVPNFNDADSLQSFVGSCLNQSLKPTEIIIIDDASTDHSRKVIENLCKRDRSIKVVYHKQNMGVIKSFNEGAKLATSEFIALRSANDFILPGFFEEATASLNTYKNAALACSDIAFFSTNPSNPQREHLNLSDRSAYINPDKLSWLLTEEHFLHGAAILLRRDAFISIGGYAESCRWYADWVAHLRLAFRSGIVYIPKIGGLYRHNSDSYSNSLENRRKYQYLALKGVLEEIEKESEDVRTRIALSGVLGFLGASLYEMFIKENRFHNIETYMLVERNRHLWNHILDNKCRSTSPSLICCMGVSICLCLTSIKRFCISRIRKYIFMVRGTIRVFCLMYGESLI